MIENGCSLPDIRGFDYQFYLQNASKFASDMRLVRAQNNMFGEILEESEMYVWQVICTFVACIA